jgi:CRP/FNR family cyclic AMP-dependent transcriptional regulator
MDELDFTASPVSAVEHAAASRPLYDAAAARRFFALRGEEAGAAPGTVIFTEEQKSSRLFLQRDKMYLLLEGEVELSVKQQATGTVKAGEIFGELASITHTTRIATATARTPCRYIALDDKQFEESLQQQPEFALAMISVIADRLRATLERLEARGSSPGEKGGREAFAFDRALMKELEDELGEKARMRYAAHKPIIEEGGAGIYMYVVLAGEVGIYIKDNLVELVRPGGMFGEMALIGRTHRLASAQAETDCELLAINRNIFIDLVKTRPKFGVALVNAVGERARYMAEQ